MHEESKKTLLQKIGLVLGPVLFFITLAWTFRSQQPQVIKMAAIALLMATWWITEAIPLFATALLPLVLYPCLGISSGGDTAPLYINSKIFLFISGFMIALAMSKWHLHRRIALWIIKVIGGSPSRIVLGFMTAAAILSMWISNTATALMMFPIGLAIILKMEEEFGKEASHSFSICLMLGIAYGCSVGGMATLVGTPPNVALASIFEKQFPKGPEISFGQWLLMAIPISFTMLIIIWLVLTKVFYRTPAHLKVERTLVNEEYQKLGPMGFEEKIIMIVFVSTAMLWTFRKKIVLGSLTIPGWSDWIKNYTIGIDDGTVGLAMALLLFLIPTKSNNAKTSMIMSADIVKKIPWDIILLFGGGFALAAGFKSTGLSGAIGEKMKSLDSFSPIFIIACVCCGLTFLTELTSNTATTQTVLPILASVAVAIKIHPLLLMIPATLSASCAFMMPVATPPNAIIFGSGRVKIVEMVRAGFFINIIGVIVITLLFYFLGTLILGIDFNSFPDWAVKNG